MGLIEFTERHKDRLVAIVQALVGIPSENTPPVGHEGPAQEYVAHFLGHKLGWEVDIYYPPEAPGIQSHPMFRKGREYAGRPNVTARRRGTGGGRSLLLTGHIDTVPRGSAKWARLPFAGEVEGNQLFGRGSNDMKAGIGIFLFLAEAITTLDMKFAGDLLVEAVVDEEFGGVNGTLAGRLRGHLADAAILGEPSGLRIIPAQRGGRIAHITLCAPGDIFSDRQGGVVEQLRVFLNGVRDFAGRRAATAPSHPLYAHLEERAPVTVTRIATGPWGTTEPIATPDTCRIELYWQAAPGESQEDIDGAFFRWLDDLMAAHPDVFPERPAVEFPIRWLPPSTISSKEPLIAELSASAQRVLGREAAIQGLEAPCDMYVFHQGFGMPAVLWGPRGGNAHQPDEYVEIDSMVDAARVLADFIPRWCGVAGVEHLK